MATWKRFFSGLSLQMANSVKLQPKWWETYFQKPNKPKLPKLVDPVRVIEGSLTQTAINSPYAGTQCTSVCLDAIAWWTNIAKCGYFSPSTLDHVILSGHFQHLYLRTILKVSTNQDLRVAIEDLPDYCDLESGRFYNVKRWQAYVSLIPTSEFGEMRSLKDFLLGFTGTPFGALVTIGDYTQAVMYNSDQKWMVFDSHGHLEFLDHWVDNGSCWIFDNVDGVIAFLMHIRPNNSYCLVARPLILSNACIVFSQSDDHLHETYFRKDTAEKSSSCPGQVQSAEYELEEDPYVSLMGGFGEY